MTEDYAAHSAPQQSLTLYCVPKFASLIESLHKENPSLFSSTEPFAIADLGCADGTNAVPLLRAILEKVRQINPSKEIVIYLNDLPNNNFEVALQNIRKGLEDFPNVFYNCVGRSFYLPLFQENSIDFCYSTMSIHWLSSKAPCTHNGFHFYFSETTRETPEGKQFASAAQADWERFLNARANELKPGGVLAVGTFATHTPMREDDMKSVNQCKAWKSALKETLAQHGLGKYEKNVTVPIVVRQRVDFPIAIKDVRLESYEVFPVTAPLYKKYEVHKDPVLYSKDYAMFVKAFTFKYFYSSLSEEGISKDLIEGCLNDYYGNILVKAIQKVVETEGGYPTVSHNLAFIRKTNSQLTITNTDALILQYLIKQQQRKMIVSKGARTSSGFLFSCAKSFGTLHKRIAIYSDEGVDDFSFISIFKYFQKIKPNFPLSTISAKDLLQRGIDADLFVMPGGADLPYLKLLKEKGNEIIKSFVQQGGSYLGICAGGYYASSSIVFAPGSPLEVKGERELKFFPGRCIGPINSNFIYGTHKTAIMPKINFVGKDKTFHAYTNGGGYFESNEEAAKCCKIVATAEIDKRKLDIMLECKYGKGKVLLSGVHFEYDWDMLSGVKEEVGGLKEIKEEFKKQDEKLKEIMSELIFN
eukprot:TRINITY_DN243_c0_g2_i1.p1 TRINITY_DN243_c0_g2~~TRINITY_DN243_c0_g2_i1.p1  ORF type:complete len:682 (+),score=66.22 TRINITY_DN243_c0_g2_i1:119-2047(+)